MAEEVKKQDAKKPEPKSKKEGKSNFAAKKKKSKRRSIVEGIVHVKATYNNTLISISEPNGDVIAWSSSGSAGFKGARKSTPYAAQVAADNAIQKAKIFGLERVRVIVNGVGSGREQAMRDITANQIEILSIEDVTAMPHNGCRKRKARRV